MVTVKNFRLWNVQESCIINGSHIAKYFKLEKEIIMGLPFQLICLLVLRFFIYQNQTWWNHELGLGIFDQYNFLFNGSDTRKIHLRLP